MRRILSRSNWRSSSSSSSRLYRSVASRRMVRKRSAFSTLVLAIRHLLVVRPVGGGNLAAGISLSTALFYHLHVRVYIDFQKECLYVCLTFWYTALYRAAERSAVGATAGVTHREKFEFEGP